MNMDWTTIATYNIPMEANLARTILESHEIPCFIKSENMGSLYFGIIGGVELQVPASFVPKALELINNSGVA
jgi:Putative prokaryotic signal transducing protein